MLSRPLLPPFPRGWYCIAFSDEIRPGRLISRQFMGQAVVIFRSASGEATVMGAFCPHLGAHFGHGGLVVGELLRCPFHHFEFDRDGVCVATGYGTKPPPLAKARTWPVQEQHGCLLAYHDEGEAQPTWEPPLLEMTGWTRPVSRTYRLRGHPQETTENSVDIGHLGIVHGYDDVKMLAPLQLEGTYLGARYAMARPAGQFIRPIQTEFSVHVHGLGYSLVEVFIKNLGLKTRQFVLATPIDGEEIYLRIALSLEKGTATGPSWPLRLLPAAWRNALLPPLLMRGFAHDVSQDFAIWEHKRFVQPPALAEGDGPVGKYRQWARQFYR